MVSVPSGLIPGCPRIIVLDNAEVMAVSILVANIVSRTAAAGEDPDRRPDQQIARGLMKLRHTPNGNLITDLTLTAV